MSEIVPICENSSLRRTHVKDKPFVSPILVTYVPKNRVHYTRAGTTTSKKTGDVARCNRSRRIIREAAWQLMPRPSGGYGLTFVARAKTLFAKSMDILCDMRKHLSQSGVLK